MHRCDPDGYLGRPSGVLPFEAECAARHAMAPAGAQGGDGSFGPSHPGAPRSERMSAAVAGPEIEAKTVNTKTDNVSNCFMIIILLSPAAPHLSMLLRFENGSSQVLDLT